MVISLDAELFFPEPLLRTLRYTIISVDDHVVDRPHLFANLHADRTS